MINKLTIEDAWRMDPNKTYYVIQNPRIDKKNQRVNGLTIKTVEYKVRDWDKDNVNFERINKDNDKRFPEILYFDKRFHDAESEVFSERSSKGKKKSKVLDSYGIFGDKRIAHYNKLMRLHRISQELFDIYNILTDEKVNNSNVINDSDDKTVKDAKAVTDKSQIDISLDEIKIYFEKIQDTDYFDELERIQSENPDLATM